MTIQNPDSVIDVLARSIMLHPSLFAEACEREAHEDLRYIASRPDMPRAASDGARARAAALQFAADSAREHESAACAAIAIMERRAASWVAAFNVACRLLCVPAHVRTALAVKESESA